jgi:mitogen-activated protein kinase kinase
MPLRRVEADSPFLPCPSFDFQPERIKGESMGAATSYTASSDVWSLGLSIIEAAIGHYPYPPETYSNVFAQLTAIVHGDPPALPEVYSETAREFVSSCLIKNARDRPTYKELMVRSSFPPSFRPHSRLRCLPY